MYFNAMETMERILLKEGYSFLEERDGVRIYRDSRGNLVKLGKGASGDSDVAGSVTVTYEKGKS